MEENKKLTWKNKIDMAAAYSRKSLDGVVAELGMARATLNNRLERKYIKREEAKSLAKYFGVTIEWVQTYPDETVDLYITFPDGTKI